MLSSGCDLVVAGNPTPGAKPADIAEVWVRHEKDKYDREATAVVGFTLEDGEHAAIAADGNLTVELKWQQGMMEYTARGKAPILARSFERAKAKPVREGTLYSEPLSIYLIGPNYPGPSKTGYDASVTFRTTAGEELTWHQWVAPTR